MNQQPKEKARELIDKFIEYSGCYINDDQYYPIKVFSTAEATRTAKACAIICVDEIIKTCRKLDISSIDTAHVDAEKIWWQQVREEINNL